MNRQYRLKEIGDYMRHYDTMKQVKKTKREFDEFKLNETHTGNGGVLSTVIPIIFGFLLLGGLFAFSLSTFSLDDKPPVTDRTQIVQGKVIGAVSVDIEQTAILYPTLLSKNQTIVIGDQNVATENRAFEEIMESDYQKVQASYAQSDNFTKQLIQVTILDGNYQVEFKKTEADYVGKLRN